MEPTRDDLEAENARLHQQNEGLLTQANVQSEKINQYESELRKMRIRLARAYEKIEKVKEVMKDLQRTLTPKPEDEVK